MLAPNPQVDALLAVSPSRELKRRLVAEYIELECIVMARLLRRRGQHKLARLVDKAVAQAARDVKEPNR